MPDCGGICNMCRRVQVGNWMLPLRKGNGLVMEAGQESLPGSG